MRRRRASSNDVRKIAMEVVWAEVYLPRVISGAQTVAVGLGPRSRGVGMARGDGVCGGEVVALPIPRPRYVQEAPPRPKDAGTEEDQVPGQDSRLDCAAACRVAEEVTLKGLAPGPSAFAVEAIAYKMPAPAATSRWMHRGADFYGSWRSTTLLDHAGIAEALAGRFRARWESGGLKRIGGWLVGCEVDDERVRDCVSDKSRRSHGRFTKRAADFKGCQDR